MRIFEAVVEDMSDGVSGDGYSRAEIDGSATCDNIKALGLQSVKSRLRNEVRISAR